MIENMHYGKEFQMAEIKRSRPDAEELEKLGVFSWPVWEKDPSSFSWTYDEGETCYILQGRFRIIDEAGGELEFGPGDLVTFPKGMKCQWEVMHRVKKHYHFGPVDKKQS